MWETQAAKESVRFETTLVNDARTHAELDQLVAKYKLENIPTKAAGATLDERKQAISNSVN